MSSPGSGKTSLILAQSGCRRRETRRHRSRHRFQSCGKVAAVGIPPFNCTGGFCHLDATMVTQGLEPCPPAIWTDHHRKRRQSGLPRRIRYRALKACDPQRSGRRRQTAQYPLMFTVCDVTVNKIDYLALSDFDVAAALRGSPGAEARHKNFGILQNRRGRYGMDKVAEARDG